MPGSKAALVFFENVSKACSKLNTSNLSLVLAVVVVLVVVAVVVVRYLARSRLLMFCQHLLIRMSSGVGATSR